MYVLVVPILTVPCSSLSKNCAASAKVSLRVLAAAAPTTSPMVLELSPLSPFQSMTFKILQARFVLNRVKD